MKTITSTRTTNQPHAFLAAVLVTMAALSGCGRSDRPELGEVTGTVTLDARPLTDAAVVFSPVEGGRQSMGFTDSDGRFELTYIRDIRGAKLGQHKVSITTASEESPEETLPVRYNSETTLTAEVKPGDNTCDFPLTSE